MSAAPATTAEIRLIPLDAIKTRLNCREHRQNIPELAESIRAKGVLEPIRVRPHGDGYQLTYGYRRYHAARLAGLTEIPAIVAEDGGGAEELELQLVENCQRVDMTTLERARAYRMLNEVYGLTLVQIGKRVGIQHYQVAQYMTALRVADSLIESGIPEERVAALGVSQLTPLNRFPAGERARRVRRVLDGVESAGQMVDAARRDQPMLPGTGGRQAPEKLKAIRAPAEPETVGAFSIRALDSRGAPCDPAQAAVLRVLPTSDAQLRRILAMLEAAGGEVV
jgi:ParB/RepB/Spo0J family partition protein